MSVSTMYTVVTKSGRQYVIDLETKQYKPSGEAPMNYFGEHGVADPEHERWMSFEKVSVDDLARLHFSDARGQWRVSTPIQQGLDELLTALDK